MASRKSQSKRVKYPTECPVDPTTRAQTRLSAWIFRALRATGLCRDQTDAKDTAKVHHHHAPVKRGAAALGLFARERRPAARVVVHVLVLAAAAQHPGALGHDVEERRARALGRRARERAEGLGVLHARVRRRRRVLLVPVAAAGVNMRRKLDTDGRAHTS